MVSNKKKSADSNIFIPILLCFLIPLVANLLTTYVFSPNYAKIMRNDHMVVVVTLWHYIVVASIIFLSAFVYKKSKSNNHETVYKVLSVFFIIGSVLSVCNGFLLRFNLDTYNKVINTQFVHLRINNNLEIMHINLDKDEAIYNVEDLSLDTKTYSNDADLTFEYIIKNRLPVAFSDQSNLKIILRDENKRRIFDTSYTLNVQASPLEHHNGNR